MKNLTFSYSNNRTSFFVEATEIQWLTLLHKLDVKLRMSGAEVLSTQTDWGMETADVHPWLGIN